MARAAAGQGVQAARRQRRARWLLLFFGALLLLGCGAQRVWTPPGSPPSPSVSPDPSLRCEPGQVWDGESTRCCWPGQRIIQPDSYWSKCVGQPQCPTGTLPWADACLSPEQASLRGVCLDPLLCQGLPTPPGPSSAAPLSCLPGQLWDGQSRYCCWPGQMASYWGCSGPPLCPSGHIAYGESCLVLEPGRRREVERCMDSSHCEALLQLERDDPRKVDAIRYEQQQGACRRGELAACHAVARALGAGKGPIRSPVDAVDLFWLNCEAGFARSCTELGHSFVIDSPLNVPPQWGMRLLRRGCELGDPAACVAAALVYDQGWLVDAEPKRAAELLEHGCALGDASACESLAQALSRGVGVEVDVQRALEVLKKPCDDGRALACAQSRRLENRSGPTAEALEQFFLSGGGRGFFAVSLLMGYHWFESWAQGPAASMVPFSLRFGMLGPVFLEMGFATERQGGPPVDAEVSILVGAGVVPFGWSLPLRTRLFDSFELSLLEPLVALRSYMTTHSGGLHLMLANRFVFASIDEDFAWRAFLEPSLGLPLDDTDTGMSFLLTWGMEWVPRKLF